MSYHTAVVTILICCLTTLLFSLRILCLRRLRRPPGPPALPIIGNLLDVPTNKPWEKYKEMGRKYNTDIIHLSVLGTRIVILNSMSAVTDLLEKRSSIYSSRPRSPMIHDLMGYDWLFGLMEYGDPWRVRRRLLHDHFNPQAVTRFHPHIIQSTQGLLLRFLDGPKRWEKHFRHAAATLIMDITYGIAVRSNDDAYVQMAEDATESVNKAAVAGAFYVEFLPFLKYVPPWVPGAGFRRKANEWRKVAQNMRDLPFRALKEAMENGLAKPSFGSYCLQNMDPNGSMETQEQVICETAGQIYMAGAESTVSVLSTFMLAMVKYPEIQTKIQAEMNAVLGKHQLPQFGDEDALPFLMATMKETMRWQVAGPLAAPHLLAQDDIYRGHTIPAGAVVISNTWAILHDENTYPDPYIFNPERFIKDGKLDTSVQDPEQAAFGYGRRFCPGKHMAHSFLWITIGSIAADFNISKALDNEGNYIDPDIQYTSGFTSQPESFECEITPRSVEMENYIRATANEPE